MCEIISISGIMMRGKILKKLFICFSFLFLYRLIVFILCNKKLFKDYISANGFGFWGVIRLIDFKWIFTTRKTEKNPIGEYLKADAKVIEAEKFSSEYYDEHGELQKNTSYSLKIKFYAGKSCVTTVVESENLTDELEIFYRVSNPYEIYPASKVRFDGKTESETAKDTYKDIFGALGFIIVILYFWRAFS